MRQMIGGEIQMNWTYSMVTLGTWHSLVGLRQVSQAWRWRLDSHLITGRLAWANSGQTAMPDDNGCR